MATEGNQLVELSSPVEVIIKSNGNCTYPPGRVKIIGVRKNNGGETVRLQTCVGKFIQLTDLKEIPPQIKKILSGP